MKRAHRISMALTLILVMLLTPAMTSLTRPEPARTGTPANRTYTPPLEHPATLAAPPPTGTASVQLLGVNDFHGNLEPSGGLGGAAYLAAHLDRQERRNPRSTIRVHAGDMVGVSPLISSYFHDEPAVYAMNEMEFDVGTLGNHEFDEGGQEMLRLINGGQRTDGRQFKDGADGQPVNTSDEDFDGVDFPYIAANTIYKDTRETALPPYRIVERDGALVGFIGVTTEDTPNIVMPEAVEPFRVLDLSETVNRYAVELQDRGVETIVVLAHAGGDQKSATEATGEIFEETAEMDDAVDVVMAGHTHNRLNARVGDKLVVEAGRYGTAFSVVDLEVDRATGDVASSEARILATSHGAPDPELKVMVADYRERVAPISGRVVGTAAERVTSAETEAGDSALGNLVADSERAAADADFAFVISGGLREDIEAGPVTYGDLFAVQPQEDRLVKMELTGQEVYDELERQHDTGAEHLQVSGLKFACDHSDPADPRIASVTLPDGAPLDPDATYTVVVKRFLATGGGGATILANGRDKEEVGTDVEALARYVEDLPQPFTAPDPAIERRMTLAK